MVLQAKLAGYSMNAPSWIRTAEKFDGKAAFKLVCERINRNTTQSKTVAILGLIGCRQGRDQSIDDCITAVTRHWLKVEKTQATLDDIRTALFIFHMNDRMRMFENSITLANDLTLAKVESEARAFEDRLVIRKHDTDRAEAMIAKAVEERMKEHAFMGNAEEKPYRTGPRKPLDNNRDRHPNSPTEFEKTKTCYVCNKPGHVSRTCPTRQTRAEEDKNSDEEEEADVEDKREKPVWKKKKKMVAKKGSGERAVQAVEQDDAEPYLSSVGFAFSAVEEDERHQDIISSVPPHVEPIPQKQSRQRKRALEGTE